MEPIIDEHIAFVSKRIQGHVFNHKTFKKPTVQKSMNDLYLNPQRLVDIVRILSTAQEGVLEENNVWQKLLVVIYAQQMSMQLRAYSSGHRAGTGCGLRNLLKDFVLTDKPKGN